VYAHGGIVRLAWRRGAGICAMKSFCLAVVVAMALGTPVLAADAPDIYADAAADTTRPKDDRDSDALRLPAQTLAFAGVKPGMVVGELFPGGGYFTRMIADVVGKTGKVYMLETTRWEGSLDADKTAALHHDNVAVDGTAFGAFNLPEKIDLFWITQNYHDLHIAKYGAVDMAVFNKRVFDALKPGGIYFILDHQANPGTTLDQIAVLHRIEKAQVIAEVTAAGFKLAGEGDFLRRADDDHTKPIFDPAVRFHTDQYALKFVKP
jgi:predicted methyltransferase